jgi:hypothetical protein
MQKIAVHSSGVGNQYGCLRAHLRTPLSEFKEQTKGIGRASHVSLANCAIKSNNVGPGALFSSIKEGERGSEMREYVSSSAMVMRIPLRDTHGPVSILNKLYIESGV